MKTIFRISVFFSTFLLYSAAYSQLETIRPALQNVTSDFTGRVGIAVIDLQNGDTITINNNHHYPMQSVFKFPIALAVMHDVEKEKLSLTQTVRLNDKNLLPNTWSPLREKYQNKNIDVTLDEILNSTVSLSDNNGCDILLQLLGGTAVVERYIHSLGIHNIAITATEAEMHKAWNVQYNNYSTPYAMTLLFKKFYQDSLFSTQSTKYLWNILVNTQTGVNRLQKKLPSGSVIGHKTGSSDVNEEGIAAATNDAGIIIMPNEKKFAIAVFVSDSKESEQRREEIIAETAGIVSGFYMRVKK